MKENKTYNKIDNIYKNRRNYGDSLWRINKTYFKYARFKRAGTRDFSRERLQRFVQSDKSLTRMNEGSGIGLSIVHSMVKLNEGEIYLESDGENGTEFEVLLPNICLKEEIRRRLFYK